MDLNLFFQALQEIYVAARGGDYGYMALGRLLDNFELAHEIILFVMGVR